MGLLATLSFIVPILAAPEVGGAQDKAAIPSELLTLQGHSDEVSSVAFSPDGRRLASASTANGKYLVAYVSCYTTNSNYRCTGTGGLTVAMSQLDINPTARWYDPTNGTVNGANANLVNGNASAEMHELLHALQAVRVGDFSVRMSGDKVGIAGKIAAKSRFASCEPRMNLAFAQ